MSNKFRKIVGDVVLVISKEEMDFQTSLHVKTSEGGKHQVEGWEHPVVVVWDKHLGISVRCPNSTVATELLGLGGLRRLLDRAETQGWTGHEYFIASPRRRDTLEFALAIAKVVAAERSRKIADDALEVACAEAYGILR